ncbi:phosphatidate cytidylyltransferase [Lichenicoccus roseus]|uniref:Phosphatidate cytidylyltransferase n=1 Tax=Lichenicoccus roseus TaxID=2683649 RepID=A0A5R9JAN5_9PROT|nr:phosphatidate cytidylyltransferase [Lichenicoccus roseus]TLU73863.1 phosphatidate cytidylyltransferase [Lichenicoccus roseus]
MPAANAASGRALAENPAIRRAVIPDAAPATTAGSWRDLRLRLISAAVLAPLGLLCLIDGGWILVAVTLLMMVGLAWEWAGLARVRPVSPAGIALLVWPGASLLLAVTYDWMAGLRLLAAGCLLGPMRGGGILVIGAAGLSLIRLSDFPGAGAASLLFVVLVVWSSDSLAYLVGRAIGGAKLAPRISPGKTRSGAAGGLLGAMLAGALVAGLASHGASPGSGILRGLLFGGLLGIAAQAGDLAESALKRRCGVKDSGRLIPGHGGLLDRLDGLIGAVPVAALLSLGCAPGQGFWQVRLSQFGLVDTGSAEAPPAGRLESWLNLTPATAALDNGARSGRSLRNTSE